MKYWEVGVLFVDQTQESVCHDIPWPRQRPVIDVEALTMEASPAQMPFDQYYTSFGLLMVPSHYEQLDDEL